MKNLTHAFTRSAALVCTAGIFAFLSACGGGGGGGSGSSGNTGGSNTAVTTTFTIPELEGTVSGANRVVTHQAYQYTAVSATTTAADYTVDWGDGSPPITQWVNATTQTKVWRKAGSPVGTLTKLKVDGSTFSATQTVVVVDQPMSSGIQHSCSILSDNTVACWGRNANGQLGLGTVTTQESTPSIVPGLSDVVALSAYGHSTCTAKADGTVWCWGDQIFTRAGGVVANAKVPQQVQGLADIVSLSAGTGSSHACAIDKTGAAFCWGSNASGQLGNGALNDPTYTSGNVLTPVAVTGLTNARQVAAGQFATCAIVGDVGEVKCWGANALVGPGRHVPITTSNRVAYPVLVPNITGAINISVGGTMSCATLQDGTVKCWGQGFYGQNSNTPITDTPTTIAGLTNIVSVSASYSHSCAIKTDRTVLCWGNPDWFGKLDATLLPTPFVVQDTAGGALSDVLALSTGYGHSCALKTDGTVRCWGWNAQGQLGDGQTVDQTVGVMALFTQVGQVPVGVGGTALALTYDGTCVVKSDGLLSCWGYNYANFPTAGYGSIYKTPFNIPVVLPTTNLIQLGQHGCGINNSQNVLCWGGNNDGQRGNGTDQISSLDIPNLVKGLAGTGNLSGVTSVSGEYALTCAVLAPNGEVACWGKSFFKIFAPSSASATNVPQLVPGLSNIVNIAIGLYHACAIDTSKNVYCWGVDYLIGTGSNSGVQVAPTLVPGLSDVTAISIKSLETCALKLNKTVVCWGNRTLPSTVQNLNNVAKVAMSVQAKCALKTDGEVWCWGSDYYAQLGNGLSTYSYVGNSVPSPVKEVGGVGNLNGVVQIAAGGNHTCAIKQNGDVVCWGLNQRGQLGAGQTAPAKSSLPLKVSGITAQTPQPRTFWL